MLDKYILHCQIVKSYSSELFCNIIHRKSQFVFCQVTVHGLFADLCWHMQLILSKKYRLYFRRTLLTMLCYLYGVEIQKHFLTSLAVFAILFSCLY